MINLEAAGGVVHRIKNGKHQVILIYRNGVWDLPKGKKERAETLQECAQREVAEETGIPPPIIENILIETIHHYKRNGKLFKKRTHWFAMQPSAKVEFVPQKKEGITKIAWVELRSAVDKVGFQNLRHVLKTFEGNL